MDNKNLDPLFIPPNYKSPATFLGHTMSMKFVIEGVILALLPVLFILFALPKLGVNLTNTQTMVACISMGATSGMLGCTGINSMTFPEFMAVILRYGKEKKVCYYNSRVKDKDEYLMTVNDLNKKNEMLSTDLLKGFVDKSFTSVKENRIENAMQKYSNIEKPEEMFFEEDVGKIKTPWEYMTGKERKKAKKAEKFKRNERRRTNGKKKIKKKKARR